MQKKKIIAFMMSAAIAASMMTGCGAKTKEYKNTDTVMFIDKNNKIDYATACTYARMMQAETYSYMQSMIQQLNSSGATTADVDMWGQSLDSTDKDSKKYKTYGEQFKGDTLDSLESLLMDKVYADEYDVTFTDDDKKACEDVASEFIKKMSKDDLKAMHTNKKTMQNVLELMTYEARVKDAVESKVDTEVSDDEAGQSTFSYIEISKKDAKKKDKKIKSLIKKVKNGTDISTAASDAGFTAQSVTFTTADPEYDEYGKEMLKKVSKMKDGECSNYKNAKGDTVILYMQSVNDESATENKKDKIISDRKDKAYEDQLDEWKDKKKITVNKDAWDSIKTDKNEVFKKMETEDSNDSSDSANGTAVMAGGDSSTTVNVTSSDDNSAEESDSTAADSTDAASDTTDDAASDETGDTDESSGSDSKKDTKNDSKETENSTTGSGDATGKGDKK